MLFSWVLRQEDTRHQLLRVTCPTTKKMYYLKVPPQIEGIHTAAQAQAWTWDIEVEDLEKFTTQT